VYRRQIERLQAQVSGFHAQKHSKDRLVDSYRGAMADFKSLLAEGYTEKQKVDELDRALAQSEGQREELVSNIAANEVQITEIELKILQLQKDLQREVATELSGVQTELFEIREKMQWLKTMVSRSVIKAPVSGMVLGLSVHTIGAVIPPGGRLLDIVPQDEKLIFEVQVSPIDIDRVKVGQVAEVRFSAFKSRDLPTILGTLIGLSAKNAILIVEFANTRYEAGRPLIEAALEAARLRFRPIIMTSMAFIFGMFPLVIASGAGAASRQSIGTGVLWASPIGPIRLDFAVPLNKNSADQVQNFRFTAGSVF